MGTACVRSCNSPAGWSVRGIMLRLGDYFKQLDSLVTVARGPRELDSCLGSNPSPASHQQWVFELVAHLCKRGVQITQPVRGTVRDE